MINKCLNLNSSHHMNLRSISLVLKILYIITNANVFTIEVTIQMLIKN